MRYTDGGTQEAKRSARMEMCVEAVSLVKSEMLLTKDKL